MEIEKRGIDFKKRQKITQVCDANVIKHDDRNEKRGITNGRLK